MTNARNACIAYINLADLGSVSGANSLPLVPASRLQNIHVARKTRASTNSEAYTFDLGANYSLDTVALIGANSTITGFSRVRVSASDPTALTGTLYDSASIQGLIDPSYGSLVSLFTPVNGRYVRIDYSDAALSYMEAGRAFIGLRHQFEYNFTVGWSRSREDRSESLESEGGQTHTNVRNSRRVLDVNFEQLSDDEILMMEEIDRIHGTHGDVLFITDPTSLNLSRASIWGRLETLSPNIQSIVSDPVVYNRSLHIVERL
jgi:hypothetical protein